MKRNCLGIFFKKNCLFVLLFVVAIVFFVSCEVPCEHQLTRTEHDNAQHWSVCTVCNQEVIDSRKNHTFNSEVTSASTCSEKGERTLTCSICDYSKTEETPASHTWSWSYNLLEHWKECSICHEKDTTSVHKHSSNFAERCSNCGIIPGVGTWNASISYEGAGIGIPANIERQITLNADGSLSLRTTAVGIDSQQASGTYSVLGEKFIIKSGFIPAHAFFTFEDNTLKVYEYNRYYEAAEVEEEENTYTYSFIDKFNRSVTNKITIPFPATYETGFIPVSIRQSYDNFASREDIEIYLLATGNSNYLGFRPTYGDFTLCGIDSFIIDHFADDGGNATYSKDEEGNYSCTPDSQYKVIDFDLENKALSFYYWQQVESIRVKTERKILLRQEEASSNVYRMYALEESNDEHIPFIIDENEPDKLKLSMFVDADDNPIYFPCTRAIE